MRLAHGEFLYMLKHHVTDLTDASDLHSDVQRVDVTARAPDGLEYDTLLLVEGVVEADSELEFFVELQGQDEASLRCDPWQERATESGVRRFRFKCEVDLLGMPARFDLAVVMAVSGVAPLRVARINIEHQCRLPGAVAPSSPLFVTSHGRSGSSWLMGLLRQHPDILVQGAHPYECRAANYWLHATRSLLQSARYDGEARPERFHLDQEKLGPMPENSHRRTADHRMLQALRTRMVERTVTYCSQNIADFYALSSESGGGSDIRYFAEKSLPRHVPRIAAALYPGFRELVLVRDLRDVACSMRAFSGKRSQEEFGGIPIDDWKGQLAQMQTGAARLLNYWLDRSQHAHLVRYEDLVTDPEATLRGIFEYLELPDDEPIRSIVQASRQDSKGEHQTTSSPQQSVGRWRTDMDTDLAHYATELFSPSLEAFGYLD